MAVINVVNRVLRGVCVRTDVKAGNARLVPTYQGQMQAPSIPFSMRHPSLGCHFKGIETRERQDHVDDLDVGDAALRAGRPDSLAGVLVSRSSLAERPWATASWPWQASNSNRLHRANKRSVAGLNRLSAVSRTTAASRRGTGAN
jgi:hypothetical protein